MLKNKREGGIVETIFKEILILEVCHSFVSHEYDTMISLIVVPLNERIIYFLGIIYLFFIVNILHWV